MTYIPNPNNFPSNNETISIKDINFDMMDYFCRTNARVEVTLKNNEKVFCSIGKFCNDIIFHGELPETIKHVHYSIQIKEFKSIKIVDKEYNLVYKGVVLNKKPLTKAKANNEAGLILINYGYRPEVVEV